MVDRAAPAVKPASRARRPARAKEPVVLVTGAGGFVGAWTVATLARRGIRTVGIDIAPDPRRLRLVTRGAPLAGVSMVAGDILDPDSLDALLERERVTAVVHLAAMQVPACRADPMRGALVNVVGTLNVFEAVRRRSARIRALVYLSSAAVFGADDGDDGRPVLDQATARPGTHYGVYKMANEGTARVHWSEFGVGSVGLRPYVVYGVGRDQGLTSDPTRAMLAAAGGRGFHLGFGGAFQMQYGADLAAMIVAIVERGTAEGGRVFNLGGPPTTMEDVVAAIERRRPDLRGQFTWDTRELPFPSTLDDAELREYLGPIPVTSLDEGVSETIDTFEALLGAGHIA